MIKAKIRKGWVQGECIVRTYDANDSGYPEEGGCTVAVTATRRWLALVEGDLEGLEGKEVILLEPPF